MSASHKPKPSHTLSKTATPAQQSTTSQATHSSTDSGGLIAEAYYYDEAIPYHLRRRSGRGCPRRVLEQQGPGGTMEVLTLAIACHKGHPPADDIFTYSCCPQAVPP